MGLTAAFLRPAAAVSSDWSRDAQRRSDFTACRAESGEDVSPSVSGAPVGDGSGRLSRVSTSAEPSFAGDKDDAIRANSQTPAPGRI